MEQMPEKRRIGRPRKTPPKSKKRVALGLKVTADVKRMLDKAADVTGRTQSHEAEYRLENSFRAEGTLDEALVLAYGRELSGLMLLMAGVMQDVGMRMYLARSSPVPEGKEWFDDPFAYRCAVNAVTFALNAIRPDGDPSVPSGSIVMDMHPNEDPQALEQRAVDMATRVADQMLRFVCDAGQPDAAFDQYALMRRKLGRLAERVRSSRPSIYDAARGEQGND